MSSRRLRSASFSSACLKTADASDLAPVSLEEINFLDEMKIIAEQLKVKSKCDTRIGAINRLTSLVKGGVLKEKTFISYLCQFYDGIVISVQHQRGSATKAACVLITQLAVHLGSRFEEIGNYVKPLTKQAVHRQRTVSEICKNTIFTIAQFSCTSNILSQFFELFYLTDEINGNCNNDFNDDKCCNEYNYDGDIIMMRLHSIEALNVFLSSTTFEVIEENWQLLSKNLNLLIFDANLETRLYAQRAVKLLSTQSPEHYKEITSKMDPKLRENIANEVISYVNHQIIDEPNQKADTSLCDPKKSSSESEILSPTSNAPMQSMQTMQSMQAMQSMQTIQSIQTMQTMNTSISRRFRSPSMTAMDSHGNSIPSLKPSIRQANGQGRIFLRNVREMLENSNDMDISMIASNIDNIVDDVIKCCSLQILAVSAISVLRSLLPLYSYAFDDKLHQIVPILLNQASKGSDRASKNAMIVLQELTNHFTADKLIKATVSSPPSPRLSFFGAYLVSSPTTTLKSDEICKCLLNIAFESYQIDIKSTVHILDVINRANSESIKLFLTNLSDKQLYSFRKVMKTQLPDIDFPPNRPVVVPKFEKSDIEWPQKFCEFVESLHTFQWKMVHAQIFIEINEAMMSSIPTNSATTIFKLALQLIQHRGFDDIEEILPGVFRNLRDEVNTKHAQIILVLFYKFCDILLVFAEFEVMMASSDLDIAINAIDFSGLLVKKMRKDKLMPIVPELALSLAELLHSERPEIRKAAVLCFVSIFSVVGQKEMEVHTAELTAAQKKLILIYLEKLGSPTQKEMQ